MSSVFSKKTAEICFTGVRLFAIVGQVLHCLKSGLPKSHSGLISIGPE